jgi:hypothetical protein
VKKNRAILMLAAIAIGIVLGAVFLRGEREKPDTAELPPVTIEAE